VYDEWLDPEAMADWMCPRPAVCRKVEAQPWVGGSLRIDIEDAGVVSAVFGRYTQLDRPRLLRFTRSCTTWPDPGVESVVTVRLEPAGPESTWMTIRASPASSPPHWLEYKPCLPRPRSDGHGRRGGCQA
jgi:uncharacterized protein YndB with AHSA1/START domain